jgi:hypothetical protein
MHKWRYKTLVIRELALSEAKLNAEGEKGWELVAVCMSDSTTARAFLKQSYEGEWVDQHADTEHALVGRP